MGMRWPPSRVTYSVLFYVLVMVLLAVARPGALFHPDGTPRRFGAVPGATMFPLGVVAVVGAVLSLYTFALIDLVTTRGL
jgi:hypothetical protein